MNDFGVVASGALRLAAQRSELVATSKGSLLVVAVTLSSSRGCETAVDGKHGSR